MVRKKPAEERDTAARHLTLATMLGSLLLAVALFGVHRVSRSQLALAQAADSLFDMLSGLALLWALRVSSQPADAEHPHGHSLAQPVAALVMAVLAGVLSAEVLRSALEALIHASRPTFSGPAAVSFAAKVLFKLAIVLLAGRSLRRDRNPALAALRMDARNDVLVGGVALLGLCLDRAALPRMDAILALGVAVYIAYAGLQLGRENASLLLGESASAERQQQLAEAARAVPSVHGVSSVMAVWRGALLHVQLSVVVDGSLSLRAAHELGHAVEQRLLSEPDVGQVTVHIEPA